MQLMCDTFDTAGVYCICIIVLVSLLGTLQECGEKTRTRDAGPGVIESQGKA
jgi:hypothetical protein